MSRKRTPELGLGLLTSVLQCPNMTGALLSLEDRDSDPVLGSVKMVTGLRKWPAGSGSSLCLRPVV